MCVGREHCGCCAHQSGFDGAEIAFACPEGWPDGGVLLALRTVDGNQPAVGLFALSDRHGAERLNSVAVERCIDTGAILDNWLVRRSRGLIVNPVAPGLVFDDSRTVGKDLSVELPRWTQSRLVGGRRLIEKNGDGVCFEELPEGWQQFDRHVLQASRGGAERQVRRQGSQPALFFESAGQVVQARGDVARLLRECYFLFDQSSSRPDKPLDQRGIAMRQSGGGKGWSAVCSGESNPDPQVSIGERERGRAASAHIFDGRRHVCGCTLFRAAFPEFEGAAERGRKCRQQRFAAVRRGLVGSVSIRGLHDSIQASGFGSRDREIGRREAIVTRRCGPVDTNPDHHPQA